MEPTINPTKQPPDTSAPAEHSLRRIPVLAWVLLAVVLTIIGLLIWRMTHQKPINRLDELQALERSSQPVTATIEERGADLQEAERSSAPVEASREERLQELQ